MIEWWTYYYWHCSCFCFDRHFYIVNSDQIVILPVLFPTFAWATNRCSLFYSCFACIVHSFIHWVLFHCVWQAALIVVLFARALLFVVPQVTIPQLFRWWWVPDYVFPLPYRYCYCRATPNTGRLAFWCYWFVLFWVNYLIVPLHPNSMPYPDWLPPPPVLLLFSPFQIPSDRQNRNTHLRCSGRARYRCSDYVGTTLLLLLVVLILIVGRHDPHYYLFCVWRRDASINMALWQTGKRQRPCRQHVLVCYYSSQTFQTYPTQTFWWWWRPYSVKTFGGIGEQWQWAWCCCCWFWTAGTDLPVGRSLLLPTYPGEPTAPNCWYYYPSHDRPGEKTLFPGLLFVVDVFCSDCCCLLIVPHAFVCLHWVDRQCLVDGGHYCWLPQLFCCFIIILVVVDDTIPPFPCYFVYYYCVLLFQLFLGIVAAMAWVIPKNRTRHGRFQFEQFCNIVVIICCCWNVFELLGIYCLILFSLC